MSPYLTQQEAAEYLRITTRTLREWTRRYDVPHRRVGRRLFYLPAELDDWLSRTRGVRAPSDLQGISPERGMSNPREAA